MKRILCFAGAVAIVTVVACADGNPLEPDGSIASASAGKSGGRGSDTAIAGQPGTPRTPAAGPVASIKVLSASAILPLNHFGHVYAEGYNASNQWTGNVRAAWTSSNPTVAVVADTGIVIPKALGTTTITGTFGGFSASATVTVVPAVVINPPPTQSPVAQFTLRGVVFGPEPGADTSKVVPVAGAVVVLFRVGTASGDTLKPSVEVGRATTDAGGKFAFGTLQSSYYRLTVTPPAGSPFKDGATGFGPPTIADFSIGVTLQRR